VKELAEVVENLEDFFCVEVNEEQKEYPDKHIADH
jgi:hypothetical protein